MSICFYCDECGKALKVSDANAGRNTQCPDCMAIIRIPETSTSPVRASRESDDEKHPARTSKGSSRSKPKKRSQKDSDPVVLPTRQKKAGKKKVQSTSEGNGIPNWIIVTGSVVMGLASIGVIAFVAMNLKSLASSKGSTAAAPQYVMSETESAVGKVKMIWEMPAKWTQESEIERGIWPWIHMKGQGQSINMATNRSLTETASTMTTLGGFEERLMGAHTFRIAKLQAENTDYVETKPEFHRGQRNLVVWSYYEYKGVFGKGYGIRCTIPGLKLPATLTMECSESARDRWRPVLLRIAESITFKRLDGLDELEDFDRPAPKGNEAVAEADEPMEDGEEKDDPAQ